MKKTQILIVDCGSQYTLVIQRTLTEIGLDSVIKYPQDSLDWIKQNKPKGIILSGGAASVYDENAPKIPEEILTMGIPLLGICYGMQWIAHVLSNHTLVIRESAAEKKGYGPTHIKVSGYDDILFRNVPEEFKAWSSHGDIVDNTPSGFKMLASSVTTLQAMSDVQKRIWALQFHPEVTHTQYGKVILSNFVYDICGCMKDWDGSRTIGKLEYELESHIQGSDVVLGISGGVDSTTLGAIASRVLGRKLHSFVIDTGGLRKGELQEIKDNVRAAGINNLHVINNVSGLFHDAMSKTIDSEEKRKIAFQPLYTRFFMEYARKVNAKFVLQGTIAPDQIESGAAGGSALIKTHHNVGLDFGIPQFNLFGHLFKHQIRDIGRLLNLPATITERQPFPGPGLFIRVVGIPATDINVDIVRTADYEVTNILKEAGLYGDISQLIVALLGINTRGVKGDAGVNLPSIVVRPLKTVDFMTVGPYRLPAEVEDEIIAKVCKHPKICRTMFDYTPKPPATMEYE
jgi:GMP synthase (glutamine-hydrolysing)